VFDIFSHNSPDGDALGSSLGLYYYLKSIKKKANLFCEGPFYKKFNFLEISLFSKKIKKNSEIAIVLDSGNLSRLGKGFQNIKQKYDKIINIDHHVDNSLFGDINFVDKRVASTSEILTNFLFEKVINKRTASAFYVALLTDSFGFSLPNVSDKTMYIASYLINKGAEPDYLWNKIFANTLYNSLKFISYIILNSKRYNDIIFATIPLEYYKKFNTDEEDTEMLANKILSVNDIDTVILIREREDSIRVSFRSKGKRDVGKIARDYGGGGHKLAAGVKFNKNLDDVVNILKKRLDCL